MHVFIIYTGSSRKERGYRRGQSGELSEFLHSSTNKLYKLLLSLTVAVAWTVPLLLLLPLSLAVVACYLHARVVPDPVKAGVMCRQIAYLDCS